MIPEVVLEAETPSLGEPGRANVWLFPKNLETGVSENFSHNEFRCHCRSSRCHSTLLHPKLVESLQTLRQLVAHPLTINSGYRCTGYNKVVGGRPRSYHTKGMAADVLVGPLDSLEDFAGLAEQIPALGGIGIYPTRNFVHIDVRPRHTNGEPVRWSG